MISNKVSTRSVRSTSNRSSVLCRGVINDSVADVVSARRSLISGFVASLSFITLPSFALIPDEEDEELVEKAKANRQKKLAAQKETTREFLKAEGLKDTKLSQDLVVVQKGVFKLAEAGSKLEAGDIKAVSSNLSEPWLSQFEASVEKIGENGKDVVTKLGSLKTAASGGDVKVTKKAYVQLVAELQSWSSAAGVANRISGIQ
ncbi:hypothetical protein CEUSTIGMA_g8418.t1 [Chlamydomonas eustigma]|uniref:Maintenance of Photosystem II under High light 2 C-terminal domain-containing protein n=1 Tax=Chlamydomonas eustigma TaxID=1157962 RepID=A0A250XD10_9CHLO|nr:hypothetical protein CEUSTIGMA_g8418.t1 [Chlamydomonas eustigma]|eukprot:GAX80983.1 hypothetical protein CEUSTIGMA_g8418.t1 [Chlamydomonas eustigma]